MGVRSSLRSGAAVLAAVCAAPAGASVFGPLDNFDVVNDTGSDTCGFEIEIEGVHAADVYRTFEAPYIRYAAPTVTDTAMGVVIHYQGAYDAASRRFVDRTPPAAPGYVPAADSCWTGGLGSAYDASGCEHFGVSQTTMPTATRYRWLACDDTGGTTPPLAEIGLPTPVWTVSPPPAPNAAPVVRAEVAIPNPEGGAWGEAYWVKIYKTEIERPAVLEDLLMEQDAIAGAETEIEWELMQAKPDRGLVFNEAPLGAGAEAVIRRYEFYRYDIDWGRSNTFIDPKTGQPKTYVDPENGEVVECVVNGCNDPTPDELGAYVGRQIAGFNVPGSACSDGLDDDGDGLVDYPADPGCRDAASYASVEDPVCQNGIDEDGDGLFDFDGGATANDGVQLGGPDPSCRTAHGGSEAPHCGFGAEIAFVLAGIGAAARRAGLSFG